MLWISGTIALLSIIMSALGILEELSIIIINVFGTMVFSWILTKKSAKHEFKEHEQDLALKSYRHINYIDTAANTAYMTIKSLAENTNDTETKLVLDRAMDHIKYIQGGINTCKLDWFDMLSVEEQQKIKPENPEKDNPDFGSLKVNMQGQQMNQEDA